MKLTESQSKAVKFDNNTLVVACPGSGKTRCLIAKLLRCIDIVRDSPRKVGCITYTNAATYEIESRLRIYGVSDDEKHCDISTIHAFCLNNILRFFHWRLSEFNKGFKILPPDSDLYQEIVRQVCAYYSLDYSSAYESFQLLNRKPDGSPVCLDPLTENIALDFWERIHHDDFIDFPNIVYFSYKLLSEFPSIAHYIACKFAWILVDEVQDTSALQIEILKIIAEQKRTNFFLVGDPFQSIFGFAGACPDLMDEYADLIGAERDFKLLDNFRSSKPIIKHAERLCPRYPPMLSSGEASKYKEKPMYIHSNSVFEAITDYFIPTLDELNIDYGKVAIMSPQWFKLLHLGRKLRNYGIPIVGPGARPYKRTHIFAILAEQLCLYIEYPDPQFIPRIERELFFLINNLTGKANFNIYSYFGRRTIFRLIEKGRKLCHKSESGTHWLKEASKSFSQILSEEEFLPISFIDILSESAEAMIEDMIKNGVDVSNLTVYELGMFANSEKNLKLITMHRAKGREFDAVALIDLHEGKIPHYKANSIGEIEEARRLLYVAMTRAKRIIMYITDNDHWRNAPTRFLGRNALNLQAI